MKKPAGTITLRSEEGEALIAQVRQSNMPHAAAGLVEQSIRMYCGLAFALQESTLSVKRLRNLVVGSSPPPKERPESATSTTSSAVLGESEGGDDSPPGPETAGHDTPRGEAAGEGAPTPKGGHRAGTGRLGADASEGAARVACHHAELAAGQRCPVCGQGT